ncbi:MAG: secretin N-terminal domain-containing protein [Pirellulaceae bacterium]
MSLLLALSLAAPILETAAQEPSAWQYRPYPLKHKTAQQMEQALSEMLSELDLSVSMVPDARANQILLRGSPRAQQMAAQLIESMDKPEPAKPPATERNRPPELQMYAVPAATLPTTLARIRDAFPDRQAVRIAAEPSGDKMVVVATPDIHRRIAEMLGLTRRSPSPPGISSQASVPPVGRLRLSPHSDQPPSGEYVIRPVHVHASQIETSLLRILGSRLEPLSGSRTQIRSRYRLQNAAGDWVEITVEGQENVLVIRGGPNVARQLARLVQATDVPRGTRGQTTRIVPFRVANPIKVKQALDAYRGTVIPASNTGNAEPPRTSPQDPPARPLPEQGSLRHHTSGVTLVGYIFQAGPPAAAAPAAAGVSDEDAQRAGQLREMGLDVEVETLPDLDVVILRGREKDVEELSRIIEELERLSVEAEPDVVIVPLVHVKGSALAGLIDEVQDDLVGGRQGRVSVFSLEKPNALLLIGWGEALAAIKKLIRKLDQPVSPETQLQVFTLKHAPATQVQATVEEFLGDREGLGPDVIVTADPRTNILIVQASPRDLQEVSVLVERLDTDQTGAVNQARIFKVENALAEDLADTLESAIDAARGGTADQPSAILEFLAVGDDGARLLQSGILNDVQITPDPRNNTLLVTAPAESMDLLAALIEQLDSPVAVAQIKVFRVVNGDANSLITMLRSLFPASTGAARGPNLAGAEGETSLVPLRFSVDTRSNSIVATGSAGDVKIIEALLLRLDEKGLNQRQNQVYRLKNAPAPLVAEAVNEFLRSQRIVQQAAPGVESPFQQLEREVVVVPEMISNTLILSATPRYFDEIAEIIEALDAEPPQVMIQVLIVEIELDNADEFGIELGLQDSVLFDRSLLGDLVTVSETLTQVGGTTTNERVVGASNEPGFDFNSKQLSGMPNSGSDLSLGTSNTIGQQGITNFAVGRMNDELGFGGLVLSASSESVSVLIRALQQSRRVDILSRPQIRTLDNQSAFIQIGERVPYIVDSNMTGTGTISNATELIDVGLILGVTPRISPDGLVVMEIDAEKSKLGDESDGLAILIGPDGSVVRAPRINTTFAQATVSAADGETIILGGMISKADISIERRVPYLADIPILGHLFRYDAAIASRKELLIILTPHIISGPEDNERIKQLETARMSWCFADVYALHGVADLGTVTDGPLLEADVPVVYPDLDPRGQPRGAPGSVPTPADSYPPVPGPIIAPPQREPNVPAPILPDANAFLPSSGDAPRIVRLPPDPTPNAVRQ